MGYSNKNGLRIVGAILVLVAVLFLLLDFIGFSFVAIGPSNGLSPAKAFTQSFSAGSLFAALPNSGALTAIMIVIDVLFVASIVLCILTGVMALVNRAYFSPLWAAIAYGLLCIVFIILAIVGNSSPEFGLTMLMGGSGLGAAATAAASALGAAALGDLGSLGSLGSLGGLDSLANAAGALTGAATGATTLLPTLWLILGLICVIVPLFMLRRASRKGYGVTDIGSTVVDQNQIAQQNQVVQQNVSGGYDDDGDDLERTIASSKSNKQGVLVQIRYSDDSGTHVVKRQIRTDSPLTVGRSESCKLVLNDNRASGRHARLTYDDLNGLVIEDVGSTNGVQVNGETIMKQRRISQDDTVRIGDSKMQFIVTGSLDEFDGERTMAAGERYHEPVRVRLSFTDDSGPRVENIILKETAFIGRMRECDVPVDSNTVSHKHARLLNLGNGRIAIEDNASSNGVLVNGEKANGATPVGTGDVLTLGEVTIRLNVGR